MRIKILDSYRGIAILMVVFFHFFSRWTAIYPYSDKYDFFSFGKLGVQLFFIISGFVILNSLEKTKTILFFLKKRIIRLLPGMLFASVITYLFLICFDNKILFPAGHSFRNLLVSLTFIEPDLITSLYDRRINFDYLSSVYWSLWPEIQFYIYISIIYFAFRKNFYLLFFSISLFISLSELIVSQFEFSPISNLYVIKNYFRVFNLTYIIPLFCFGVYFYKLFINKKNKVKTAKYLHVYFSLFIFIQIYKYLYEPLKITFLFLFIVMFFVLIFKDNRLGFFERKWLIKLGVSSYFLYLIHESIGVVLIDKFSSVFFPYFTIILIFLFSYLSYKFTYLIDNRIARYLKKKYLN